MPLQPKVETPRRLSLATLLAAFLLIVGALPGITTPALAYSTPSGLTSPSQSISAIALTWNNVPGAPAYRVSYATTSSFSDAKTKQVSTNYADITGLAKGRSYYFRVRVIKTDGTSLTSYSRTYKSTTKASGGYSHLAPWGLRSTGTTASTVSLAWLSRGTGIRYRIMWSTSSTMSSPVFKRVDGTGVTLTGLASNKKYYFKIRVIDSDGGNLSSYSTPAISATTKYSYATPSGLTRVSTSRSAVALKWTAVSSATRYRIQYSTSSVMSSPKYAYATGNYAEVTGLSSSKKYYFRVQVVNSTGGSLGAYSSTYSTYTRSRSSYADLSPTGLAGTPSTTSVALKWTARGTTNWYRIQYSTSSSMTNAVYKRFNATSGTIGGLKAGTRYYFKVRVITSTGSNLSEYSPAIFVVTRTQSAPLRVITYNIKCANCYSALVGELPWEDRRDTLIAAIKQQKPDVLAIQEASQGWLRDPATGSLINKSQFEDLVQRLGSPYKLTNSYRNNCVKHTTPTGCVPRDWGASQGTKILYNSSTVSLKSQGSRRLSYLDPKDNQRYVSWAILRHLPSGKDFFFTNTHLEPRANTAGTTNYDMLREKQAKEIVATISAKNPSRLPVIAAGDYNSTQWVVPNRPRNVMEAAGYVDPLGIAQSTRVPASTATVEKRINTNFSSYNGFQLYPPRTSDPTRNGTYLDYFFASASIRVAEVEHVVKLDSAGYFLGIIPSDHNMLRATVYLP